MSKYIVLGHMRSGSSVLNEALEFHPDLNVAYEIFHPASSIELTNIPDIKDIMFELYGFRKWTTTESIFCCRWQKGPDEEIFSKQGKFSIGEYRTILDSVPLDLLIEKVFERYDGFKILYNQLRRNYKVWDYLASYPDLKVVHIYRRNALESLVSLYLAHSSGDWQRRTWGKKIDDQPFYLDPKIAEEYFYSMDFEIEHYTSMFKNSINIEYNDLMNWDETLFKVQDFLEVKRQPLEKKYLKRNTKNIPELILNYKELVNVFKDTKWASHFCFRKLFI